MANQSTLKLRKIARITGVLYLILFLSGVFAEGAVRLTLIVPEDAATTASNILNAEGLYRAGIVSDLIMVVCDIAVGLLFYLLLRPVSKPLSLLAAFFRLAQAATLGLNLLNLFIALQLLHGIGYLAAFSVEQLQGLAMLFLSAHGIGYDIALVFFGLYLMLLGYLFIRSGYFPKTLGIMLIVAAISYLGDSFTSFLFPSYAELTGQLMVAPAVIAEFSIIAWLLIRGVRDQEPSTRASLPSFQTEGIGAN